MKSLVSLDVKQGYQYRIILESGMLLCQLRNMHKQRDEVLKHVKTFIKNAIKSKLENIEGLEELIKTVIPDFNINTSEEKDEQLSNPIVRLLVEALFSNVKKVKEAFEEAKEKTFAAGEESQKLIKDLAIKLKQVQRSEKYLKKEMEKIVILNKSSDNKYYAIEQSKQELVKMRDSDYDAMKIKNTQLKNELNTLQKYYNSKIEECEGLANSKQEWIEKYEELSEVVKIKEEEITKLKAENIEYNLNNSVLSKELKDLKNHAISLSQQNLLSKLDKSSDNIEEYNSFNFTLFTKLADKLIIPQENTSNKVNNKIGIIISSYLKTKDIKILSCVNKKLREYYSSNTDILKLICNRRAETNTKYKKMIVTLKEKADKLEIENNHQKKYLFMKYDDAKAEIKDYLVEFICDTYDPGKKIKDCFNKSCNMLINYCRISDIEDPIERINKEKNVEKSETTTTTSSSSGGGGSYGLGILKQSINMIGSTFTGDTSQSKKTEGSDKSPQKESSKNQDDDKKAKQSKSNGIFGAFWGSREVEEETKKPKANESSSKHSSNKPKEAPVKSAEAVEESPDDFFSKNLDNADRTERSTMALPNPPSIDNPNISSFEVFSYYRENPKELMKLFNQIGSKIANSKDGRSGKWIQDIIKNYVTLLLYSVNSFEEINKLNKIKEYFAIKIEKTLEEKKDCLKNIEALQEEIKYEHKKKEEALEDSRKAKTKLVEKSAEFTVKMNELLNIKEEKDEAVKIAENAEKKHKETKKKSVAKMKALIAENTDLLSQKNDLQEIVDEMTEFMYRVGIVFS